MGITTFSQNKWGGRSDWSRPSITATAPTTISETPLPAASTAEEVETSAVKISQPRFSAFGKTSKFTSLKSTSQEEPIVNKEENTVQISQPRFSVFGKKAKFESINQKSLEQDRKPLENDNNSKQSRRINKFELHLSNKSAANKQQKEQDKESSPNYNHLSNHKKRRQGVTFDPVFLERVCLFREAQCPSELKEAHDKRLQNPPFRIICPNWPPQQTSDYYTQKNILLNKKTFYVQRDNSCIKGKLMVRNLALDKSVSIRYTFDSWTTVSDIDGVFFGPNPKNVAFDIYEFSIDLLGFGLLKDRGEVRGKIEFAIRFTAGDKDYCDNNDGRNYQIKVICDPLNDPWAEEKALEKKEKEKAKDNIKHHVSEEEEEEDEYPDEEENDEEEDVCLLEEEEVKNEKHNSFTNALKGYKHAKPFHLNKRQPWLGTRYDFGQSLSLAKRAPYESWSNTVKADLGSITDYFLVKPITIKPTTPPPPMMTAGTVVEQAPTPSSSTNTTSYNRPSLPSSVVSFSNYPQMTATTSTPTSVNQQKDATISAPSFSKPMYMFSSASAPPSPRVSPTLPSASPTRPNLHQISHSTSAAIPTLTTSASPLDINSTYYLDLVNKYCFYDGNDSTTTTNNDSPQLSLSSI